MDEKTERQYRDAGQLPSQLHAEHTWRTRPDPFEQVWPGLKQMLELDDGLEAKTLFEYLQRKDPGRFADGQLRTLQRRVKVWRALEGPAKETYFAQVHEPGRLCQSDFTHMTSLAITIHGRPFDHLLYHFVLTYSNWETASICFSESFEALIAGLQDALWELGGVPHGHQTDCLSAAVHKLDHPEAFTARYAALMRHYGLEGRKTNPSSPHENGCENVLAFGQPGSGKTHLLCAIGLELIYAERRVLFRRCDVLVQELLAAKRDLTLPKLLKQWGRFDLLIIDDIGYVQHSRQEMEVFFNLLAHRYERGSVMITSNLPFSQWEEIFKDPMTTAAAIDRLVHHSVVLELNVPSYRLEESKKRRAA